MSSKESTKNMNGLEGNTKLNWEKEKKLLAKCDRESRIINRQSQEKTKTEDTDLSWEKQTQLEQKYLRESSRIKQHRSQENVEDTHPNWLKEKELLARYQRESRLTKKKYPNLKF